MQAIVSAAPPFLSVFFFFVVFLGFFFFVCATLFLFLNFRHLADLVGGVASRVQVIPGVSF